MSVSAGRAALVIVIFISASPRETLAQDLDRFRVGYGVDLDFANRYVWRGITRTNGPVLQPQAHAELLFGGCGLSAGVWGNDELGNSGVAEASDFAPGVHGVGEVDYWLQYSRSSYGIDWALGGLRYDFNGRVPGTTLPRKSTTELYGRIQLSRRYLSPTISLWQDVDQVKGAFLDGSLTVPVFANPLRLPFIAIYLSLSGGASLGQERKQSDTTAAYNFLRRGFTSADLALGTRVVIPTPAGALRARLDAHQQFSRDPLTRHVRRELSDRPHKGRLWVSLQLGWGFAGGASGTTYE